MARFSRVSVQLEDANPEVCVAAFKNSLRAGSLNSDLTRRSTCDMMDLWARVQEFILVEHDDQTKKEREDWCKDFQSDTTAPAKSRTSKDSRPAQIPRQSRPTPYHQPRKGPQSNT